MFKMMKVALLQMEIKEGDKEANINHALELIEKVAGVDFIMLPELWPVGYSYFKGWIDSAESLDGPIISTLKRKARELNAYIHSGSIVEKRDGKYFNTSVLINPKGEIIAKYSKSHLFPLNSSEPMLVERGKDCSVVDTEFGKIGLAICYDIRFPEFFRFMTDRGAEIFAVCLGWQLTVRLMHYPIMVQSRAIDNQAYVLTCNAAGGSKQTPYFGWSMVVDPTGQIVAAGKIGEEDIVYAEINVETVRRVRKAFPYIYDSRYKVVER
jgi:predicted amidohydrolase